jgi:hypothetical protein
MDVTAEPIIRWARVFTEDKDIFIITCFQRNLSIEKSYLDLTNEIWRNVQLKSKHTRKFFSQKKKIIIVSNFQNWWQICPFNWWLTLRKLYDIEWCWWWYWKMIIIFHKCLRWWKILLLIIFHRCWVFSSIVWRNGWENVEKKMLTMKNLEFKNSLYHLSKINKDGPWLVNFSSFWWS